MRKNVILMALAMFALALPVGCDKEPDGRSKYSTLGYGGWGRTDNGGGISGFRKDTALYVTGVVFDEGYDWRSDTLYRRTDGYLALFKNDELVLALEAGPKQRISLDPDMHHLIDGHLYTEYSDDSKTTIGRDGKALFSYYDREILCGLLVEGEDVYTLGASRIGNGFSLRKNGIELMSRREGSIIGRMAENPAYPGGALYKDHQSLCFCYSRESQSVGKECVMVIDGTETAFPFNNPSSFDIRIVDGNPLITPKNSSYDRRYTYTDGVSTAEVISYNDRTLSASSAYARFPRKLSEKYYFFSSANAFLMEGTLFMAVTPQKEGYPFIWENGETRRYEINGFLTGVEVSVSP